MVSFGPATVVADSKAHNELRDSETNHNANVYKAAILGMLDAVGVAVFSLVRFLMTVCTSEMSSKVCQLLLQLSQL